MAIVGAFAASHGGTAHAQSTFNPYGSVGYEHNSNLFALPDNATAVLGTDTTRADSDLRSVAGLAGSYFWDLQQLTFDVEGRRFDYHHFSSLDHNEYLLDGKLLWKIASLLDGKVDYREEHQMAPFTQRISTALTLQTDSTLLGTANLNIGPAWRLETSVGTHRLDSPQTDLPAYGLRETLESVGLKYVAISNLSFGVKDSYEEGTYHGAAAVPNYTQNTAQLDLSEKLSGGTSTLSASVGRTTRSTAGAGGNTSATVGSLTYQRQLTGKTHVNIAFNRTVNSYITAGSSELDTGVTAGAQWAATSKVAVTLQYQWLRSQFSALAAIDPINAGREDHARQGDLAVEYQALSWLKLRLYGDYQRRNSNIALFTYNGNIVGAQFTASFGTPQQL